MLDLELMKKIPRNFKIFTAYFLLWFSLSVKYIININEYFLLVRRKQKYFLLKIKKQLLRKSYIGETTFPILIFLPITKTVKRNEVILMY